MSMNSEDNLFQVDCDCCEYVEGCYIYNTNRENELRDTKECVKYRLKLGEVKSRCFKCSHNVLNGGRCSTLKKLCNNFEDKNGKNNIQRNRLLEHNGMPKSKQHKSKKFR